MIDSTPADAPTFGVEEEFLLTHPTTGQPMPVAEAVIGTARDLGVPLYPELTSAQVEINTPVCRGARELHRHLTNLRSAAAAATLLHGARLLAVGFPLVTGDPIPPGHSSRHQAIAERYGPLATEHAICGCHVHVAVPDRETAVQVSNQLRPWLPTLLALTANSPVHQGRDTGYASWRAMTATRWPCSGIPPHFISTEHYDNHVAGLIDSGAVLDVGMLYWDVRPSSHLPTIEVRIADTPLTTEDTTLLAILTRALVVTAVRAVHDGASIGPLPAEAINAARWRSAQGGLAGTAVDPFSGRAVPAARMIHQLVRTTTPVLREFGELRMARTLLSRVLHEGNGAQRQRTAMSDHPTMAEMVEHLARRTLAGNSPSLTSAAAARA